MNIHWKDWCWSWRSNTLATWCKVLAHWKRPWCWKRLRAGGEGDDRGWDGWMASLTQRTWVWPRSRRWWRTRKGLACCSPWDHRVGPNLTTEQQKMRVGTTQMYDLRVVYLSSLGSLAGFSAWSLTSPKSRCLQVGSYQDPPGRTCFLGLSGHWPNSVPGSCRQKASFPCWLEPGRCSQLAEATTWPGWLPPSFIPQSQQSQVLSPHLSLALPAPLQPHLSDWLFCLPVLLSRAHLITLSSGGWLRIIALS